MGMKVFHCTASLLLSSFIGFIGSGNHFLFFIVLLCPYSSMYYIYTLIYVLHSPSLRCIGLLYSLSIQFFDSISVFHVCVLAFHSPSHRTRLCPVSPYRCISASHSYKCILIRHLPYLPFLRLASDGCAPARFLRYSDGGWAHAQSAGTVRTSGVCPPALTHDA